MSVKPTIDTQVAQTETVTLISSETKPVKPLEQFISG